MSGKTVVTGAAGFIGSQLVNFLLGQGQPASDLILFDEIEFFNTRESCAGLRRNGLTCLDFRQLPGCLTNEIKEIFHLGAISNTEETRKEKLDEQNVKFSQTLWDFFSRERYPFFLRQLGFDLWRRFSGLRR